MGRRIMLKEQRLFLKGIKATDLLFTFWITVHANITSAISSTHTNYPPHKHPHSKSQSSGQIVLVPFHDVPQQHTHMCGSDA